VNGIEPFKVGFDVLTVVVMNNSTFCNITPCSLTEVTQRFGGTCHLYLKGQRKCQARNTDFKETPQKKECLKVLRSMLEKFGLFVYDSNIILPVINLSDESADLLVTVCCTHVNTLNGVIKQLTCCR
jgi:hypothetical protein